MSRRPLIVFDMDGVLVDVRRSYHRAILETVRHFTGRRVEAAAIGAFKARAGYNDDWKLTRDWIRRLGVRVSLTAVRDHFEQLYNGRHFDGYIRLERWRLSRPVLEELAGRAALAIFTGRPRPQALFTLERFGVRRWFSALVALEDVRRPKPDPEGLLRLLDGRAPQQAFYLGDSADDALAARRAGVPFLAVLGPGEPARSERVRVLRAHGALAVLPTPGGVRRWLE
jgi:HAD superfamily phosphatase